MSGWGQKRHRPSEPVARRMSECPKAYMWSLPPPSLGERRHCALNLKSGGESSQRLHKYRRGILDDYRPERRYETSSTPERPGVGLRGCSRVGQAARKTPRQQVLVADL